MALDWPCENHRAKNRVPPSQIESPFITMPNNQGSLEGSQPLTWRWIGRVRTTEPKTEPNRAKNRAPPSQIESPFVYMPSNQGSLEGAQPLTWRWIGRVRTTEPKTEPNRAKNRAPPSQIESPLRVPWSACDRFTG